MKISAYDYHIKASKKICKEIEQNIKNPFCKINFYNFTENDFYYDDDGNPHEMEIDNVKRQIIIF